MGMYYIIVGDGSIYELDSTSGMMYVDAGTLSEYKLEDGATVSDHYVNNAPTLNLSGTITDVKSMFADPGRAKSTDEWIRGLLRLKHSVRPFSVVWRDDTSASSSSSSNSYRLGNCLFKDIVIRQNVKRGSAFGWHSYDIELAFQQVRFAKTAELKVERANLLGDAMTEQTEGSSATAEVENTEGEKPSSFSLSDWAKRGLSTATSVGVFATIGRVRPVSSKLFWESESTAEAEE
jgi:hypothetical protein